MRTLNKRILRELPTPVDRSSWIVSIEPAGVGWRRKHSRDPEILVTWETIWRRAMDLAVMNRQRKKKLGWRPATGGMIR